jgi:hypothetical protein
MRSGKSFVSDHLADEYDFVQLRFAGPLKDDIRSFGFPEWAIVDKPDWMRLFMQAYGQARRALNQNHWVGQLVLDIENIRATQLAGIVPVHGIVIDDMRFINEADALRDLNPDEFDVKLIRLYRTGDPGDVSHVNDVSECDLDHYREWDAIIQAEAGNTFDLTSGVTEYLWPKHG